MKRLLPALVFCLWLSSAYAEDSAPQHDIGKAIQAFADEDPDKRRAAFEDAVACGMPALAELRKAAESQESPGIRGLALRAIEEIRWARARKDWGKKTLALFEAERVRLETTIQERVKQVDDPNLKPSVVKVVWKKVDTSEFQPAEDTRLCDGFPQYRVWLATVVYQVSIDGQITRFVAKDGKDVPVRIAGTSGYTHIEQMNLFVLEGSPDLNAVQTLDQLAAIACACGWKEDAADYLDRFVDAARSLQLIPKTFRRVENPSEEDRKSADYREFSWQAGGKAFSIAGMK